MSSYEKINIIDMDLEQLIDNNIFIGEFICMDDIIDNLIL